MKEIKNILQSQIADIKSAGTFKSERIIETPQENLISFFLCLMISTDLPDDS